MNPATKELLYKIVALLWCAGIISQPDAGWAFVRGLDVFLRGMYLTWHDVFGQFLLFPEPETISLDSNLAVLGGVAGLGVGLLLWGVALKWVLGYLTAK